MKSRGLLISLLVSAVVVVDAAAVVWARETSDREMHPSVVLLLALANSQVGLLATFLVFGGARVFLRSVAVLVLTILWSLALRGCFGPLGPESSEWAFYLLAVAAAVAAPMTFARSWNVRLLSSGETTDAAPPTPASPWVWQFSLRRILAWTALVAVILAGRKLISLPSGDLVSLAVFVVSVAIVILLAVWSILGTGHVWRTLPAAACLGIPLSVALKGTSETVWFETALATTNFVLTVAMLAVVRQCGYRLVRVGRGDEQRIEVA